MLSVWPELPAEKARFQVYVRELFDKSFFTTYQAKVYYGVYY